MRKDSKYGCNAGGVFAMAAPMNSSKTNLGGGAGSTAIAEEDIVKVDER